MATVTVYTATRMKEIEDGTIVNGEIIGGNLILTKYDGSLIDAGPVSTIFPAGPISNHIFFGAYGLGLALGTLGNSWFGFDPADYAELGPSLEWRAIAVASSLVVGDDVEIQLFEQLGAGMVFLSGITDTTIASGQRLVTPWSTTPSSVVGGYMKARNITAARGVIHNAWIEIRRAA